MIQNLIVLFIFAIILLVSGFRFDCKSSWLTLGLIVGSYLVTTMVSVMSTYVVVIWIGYALATVGVKYLQTVKADPVPPPTISYRQSRVISIEEVED